MKLNVAVQMDPIARINIRGDSTFALLLEAQKRGHGLSYYTPDKLSLVGSELFAPVQLLTVRDEQGNHFTLGEPRREQLSSFETPRKGAAPQDEVLQSLMVRSAATPRVSNHLARRLHDDRNHLGSALGAGVERR